jgi:hypothetical protein
MAPLGRDLLNPEGIETSEGMAVVSWMMLKFFLPRIIYGSVDGILMSYLAISPLLMPILILWISSPWPVLSQQQLHTG